MAFTASRSLAALREGGAWWGRRPARPPRTAVARGLGGRFAQGEFRGRRMTHPSDRASLVSPPQGQARPAPGTSPAPHAPGPPAAERSPPSRPPPSDGREWDTGEWGPLWRHRVTVQSFGCPHLFSVLTNFLELLYVFSFFANSKTVPLKVL